MAHTKNPKDRGLIYPPPNTQLLSNKSDAAKNSANITSGRIKDGIAQGYTAFNYSFIVFIMSSMQSGFEIVVKSSKS